MWCPALARLAVSAFLLLPLAVGPEAQQRPTPQLDPEFARLVREWTTAPEFTSPLVDHLPVVGGVPSPRDVLGYHVGAPKKLTSTTQAYAYYRALAARTPRVKVLAIGKTDEGREILVVFVGSEESIRNLEMYRQYLARLADPRTLTEAQARELIATAKPIYLLIAGLHSAETGPPEMLMELAYRLAVEELPLVEQIRNTVITALLVVAEPDGRDRYVDWYYRHLVNIDEERQRLPGPPYWGKYVFHDNNRDINYSQVTTRAVLDWYLHWHPPIVHDLHESMPFLYTFSGQAPQNPNLDPILFGEMPWFATFEMTQLTKYGMPGVWTHAFVDMWSPGYLAFMASNHNGMARMYEAFGNGGATTMKRVITRSDHAGGDHTSREWYRPRPPYSEVVWSMRNNTNYTQTAVLSALQLTAQFPTLVLENFYVKSRNAVDAGRTEAPYAFVLPIDPNEPTRTARLVNLLRVQGIEVGRAPAAITVKDGTVAEGSFVVKRDQPYGRLAKTLLERQQFPDANLRTYDDTAWTLGLMLQAEVRPIGDPAILGVATEPVAAYAPRGTLSNERGAAAFLVADYGAIGMVTLRYRLRDLQVQALEQTLTAAGAEWPAGSFVVPAAQGRADVAGRVRNAIESLGLRAIGVPALPDDVAMHDVDVPRIAIYSTWGYTQNVGWVRHAFDSFEVPYELIYKEQVRNGGLRAAFDVIVMPDQGRGSRSIVYDVDTKGRPLAYKKSAQFQSLGMYGESDDISGGMSLTGVVELKKFVESGGLLVTLGQASFLPADFGLTGSVEAARTSSVFYAPGPIVEAEILKRAHPIFYGYRERTVPVRYAGGPLLTVGESERADQVLMRYPGGSGSILSGLMKGADEIRNRPAVVDVPVGKGRIVLFAGNPCYRWQNHGEFRMLFNAVLSFNDVPPPGRSPAAPRTASGR